jgi:peptidoglycan/LPS O-acetylase OafA/YrhL
VLILLLAIGCSVLRFHSPVGYPWTLNLFALAGGVWLLAEVRHFALVRPPAITEWAGSWSYSLYLVHLLALSSLRLLPMPEMPSLLLWAGKMGYVLAFALLFAWLVEFPSHKLARLAARSRSRTTADAMA